MGDCLDASQQLYSSVLSRNSQLYFRSGLFPGHSNNLIFFVLRKSVTIFALWHGAPSCINISQLCTVMCNSNFSLINSRYFLPIMVVPGSRKNSSLGWNCSPNDHTRRVFHGLLCESFIVPSSWWSPLQFSSSRQTAELLFRRKTKLAGLSSLCIFSPTASTSTSLQVSVSVF